MKDWSAAVGDGWDFIEDDRLNEGREEFPRWTRSRETALELDVTEDTSLLSSNVPEVDVVSPVTELDLMVVGDRANLGCFDGSLRVSNGRERFSEVVLRLGWT